MKNKPIDIIKYRGKRIKVYADEDGQSYYFIYKGENYGCGTYNIDYIAEVIYIVDKDLDKVFYVKPLKEHKPAARVYKRYGCWYMNYDSFINMCISYENLSTKRNILSKVLSKQELTDEVHSIMGMIDEEQEKLSIDKEFKDSEVFVTADDFVSIESTNFVKPLYNEDLHFIKDEKEYSTSSLIAEHEILELLKKYLIKDDNSYHIEVNKMNEDELKVIKSWFEGK